MRVVSRVSAIAQSLRSDCSDALVRAGDGQRRLRRSLSSAFAGAIVANLIRPPGSCCSIHVPPQLSAAADAARRFLRWTARADVRRLRVERSAFARLLGSSHAEYSARRIALPDLPLAKRTSAALGCPNMPAYAAPPVTRLDYTNHLLWRAQPRLDIVVPDIDTTGRYDFIIASDVLEARDGAGRALRSTTRIACSTRRQAHLLGAVFARSETVEHFADLLRLRMEPRDGGFRLVNHAADGSDRATTTLFSRQDPVRLPQMSTFSARGAERAVRRARLRRGSIADEPYLPFGIHWP